MTNNDIFRRIRYLFKLNDSQVVNIYQHVEVAIQQADVLNWLKKEDDPSLVEMTDQELAAFLNGLIIEKRGKKEGPTPEAEEVLSNNTILRKLKIALDLKSDDILAAFESIDKKISKHELSSFFRNPDHSSYRPLMDQYLRNFLQGLSKKT